MSASDPKRTFKRDAVDLDQGRKRAIQELDSHRIFRGFSLNGPALGLAHHEEMAPAVLSRGATFTTRGVQPIRRRWP
jgi:hypothetical protein